MVPSRDVENDEGQIALPMVVMTLAAAVVAVAVLMVLGRLLVDRADAQAAADAAALAGAAEGVDAARAIARGNGATVEEFDVHGAEVTVRVTVGWASASARAGRVAGSP